MKKFFTNGVFALKWILRLAPIFLIIVRIITFQVMYKSYNINIDGATNGNLVITKPADPSYSVDAVYGLLNPRIDESTVYTYNTLGFRTLFESFAPIVCNDELYVVECDYYIQNIILFLVYEIYISFAFIVFDVFHFMFTTTSKFLNKGESLNE